MIKDSIKDILTIAMNGLSESDPAIKDAALFGIEAIARSLLHHTSSEGIRGAERGGGMTTPSYPYRAGV